MAQQQIRGNTQIMAATVTNAEIAAAAGIVSTKLADGANFLKRDGTVALTAPLSAGGFSITGLGTPTSAADAATKAYVDAAAVGYDTKPSVRMATTANITLSGIQTVDTVAGSADDRTLVKNQNTASENGIYLQKAGAWVRSADADTSAEVTSGMYTYVSEGAVNGSNGFVLITADPITLGGTALTFTQTSGAGQITAGTGIAKAGNTLSIDSTVLTATSTHTVTGKSIAASQLTGTLAAGQFPALTGDVVTTAGALGATVSDGAITLAKQANLPANSVIANSTISAAPPTAVGFTGSPTANTAVKRDATANSRFNNISLNLATIATAAGTTTLATGSAYRQQFTGTNTQTVVLPDATTLNVGHTFFITNRSSGVVTVNANGGSLVQSMAAGSQLEVAAVTVGTAAGAWDAAYSTVSTGGGGGGGGTVSSVSVVTANGFAGTVATSTTTPAITLTTGITGLLKGNGAAISAATVGTDYVNAASFVFHEVPTGLIDGSNTSFTLANTPTSGTLQLFKNGILLDIGAGNDFTLATATITMLLAPATGDKLKSHYMK